MPNTTRSGAPVGVLLQVVRITTKRGVTRATVVTLGSPVLAVIALLGGSCSGLAQKIARLAITAFGMNH